MANTIKISKSKNLIFKKLSFLYLVFILFLFLSSPGKFLDHYENLEPAQEMVITKLKEQLKSLPENDTKSIAIKMETEKVLASLEELRENYHQYRIANHIAGEKLKENLFATKEILQSDQGSRIQSALSAYNTAYQQFGGTDLRDELLNLYDFSDQHFEAKEYFFKETPNAVIESVINHLQTTVLLRSIELLKGEKAQLFQEEVLPAGQLDLIQNFKKSLTRGEEFLFKIRVPDSVSQFGVLLNGQRLAPNNVDSAYQYFRYLPPKTGNYNLDILLDDRHFYHNFKVVKPGLKVNRNGSNFISQVGESQVLRLNPKYLPEGELSFKSEHADIKVLDDGIAITPFHPGAFNVQMIWQGNIIDSIALYAQDVSIIDVALMDLAGKENNVRKVAYLEASNPFWQVVNFRLKISYPNGKQRVLHNATRFLRSELKEAIIGAPEGSILAFEQIKVIGKNGYTYRDGRSILKML